MKINLNTVKAMLPYLLACAMLFYLSPLTIKDTGSGMALLLVALPGVCLVSSILYGMRKGFHWLFPVLVGLLFLPAVFLFYNSTALFYAPVYGGLALLGNILGVLLGVIIKRFSKKG